MNIMIESDYNAMSETAAALIYATMLQNNRVNLALTAGATPKRTYELLIPKIKQKPSLSHVHYYQFDEVPLPFQSKGFTLSQLETLLYEPAHISGAHIHPLTLDNYRTYDDTIAAHGGLDLMLIGIGADGHFCGNMPGSTQFHQLTYRVTDFAEKPWFQAFKTHFSDLPTEFVTMGAKSIMRVKHLVLIADGAHKASAIAKALQGEIDPTCPASILQLHPNLTVILDTEAAKALPCLVLK